MHTPRYELGRKVKERGTYTGIISVISKKKAGIQHLCLADVTDVNGSIVADHVWFTLGKGFRDVGWLSKGDRIQLDARVKTYQKGWLGARTDYKLFNPTKIKVLERAILPEMRISEEV